MQAWQEHSLHSILTPDDGRAARPSTSERASLLRQSSGGQPKRPSGGQPGPLPCAVEDASPRHALSYLRTRAGPFHDPPEDRRIVKSQATGPAS